MAARTPVDRSAATHRAISPLLKLALTVGIAVHLIGFLVFRISSSSLPKREEKDSFIQFVAPTTATADEVLVESAALLDSAPLFVPTQWNSARGLVQKAQLGEQIAFPDFVPDIELAEVLRPEGLQLTRAFRVQSASDVLELGTERILVHFGEFTGGFEAFSDAGAFAEIKVINSVFDHRKAPAAPIEIPADLAQVDDTFPDLPASFHMWVNGDGRLIGEPLLARSSGSSEFDVAALNWLLEPKTLVNLPAGYLEVQVFP